jgi:site-specific DNA-cytosine methylase
MENVPRLAGTTVFAEFCELLESNGYTVAFRTWFGPRYGLAQSRRRLVLLASRIGPIEIPEGRLPEERFRTVRDVIGRLRPVPDGEADPKDRLHVTRKLSALNAKRIKNSRPGGTWDDWPDELLADCHRMGQAFAHDYHSGAQFRHRSFRPSRSTPRVDASGSSDAAGISEIVQVPTPQKKGRAVDTGATDWECSTSTSGENSWGTDPGRR